MLKSKPRVLVIDDCANTLRVYTRLLRPDFVVTEEASASSALRRIESGELFDVILCDRHLGRGMSGEQLFEALGASRSGLQSRFVICSGQSVEADDVFGRSLGDRYFVKTSGPAALIALLLHVASSWPAPALRLQA